MSWLPVTLVLMVPWTDGAACTLTERPDDFVAPGMAPLPAAKSVPQLTPGVVVPPSGFASIFQAVAPENFGEEEKLRRGPAASSDVSFVLMMVYVVGYGSRNSRQPFNVAMVGGPQPSSPVPPNPTSRLNLPQNPY